MKCSHIGENCVNGSVATEHSLVQYLDPHCTVGCLTNDTGTGKRKSKIKKHEDSEV